MEKLKVGGIALAILLYYALVAFSPFLYF